MASEKPDCLYDPDLCPCPRGPRANCPRYKNCEACIAFHSQEGNPPQTACERKAGVLRQQRTPSPENDG